MVRPDCHVWYKLRFPKTLHVLQWLHIARNTIIFTIYHHIIMWLKLICSIAQLFLLSCKNLIRWSKDWIMWNKMCVLWCLALFNNFTYVSKILWLKVTIARNNKGLSVNPNYRACYLYPMCHTHSLLNRGTDFTSFIDFHEDLF